MNISFGRATHLGLDRALELQFGQINLSPLDFRLF
jgi:hypothetical protein